MIRQNGVVGYGASKCCSKFKELFKAGKALTTTVSPSFGDRVLNYLLLASHTIVMLAHGVGVAVS